MTPDDYEWISAKRISVEDYRRRRRSRHRRAVMEEARWFPGAMARFLARSIKPVMGVGTVEKSAGEGEPEEVPQMDPGAGEGGEVGVVEGRRGRGEATREDGGRREKKKKKSCGVIVPALMMAGGGEDRADGSGKEGGGVRRLCGGGTEAARGEFGRRRRVPRPVTGRGRRRSAAV